MWILSNNSCYTYYTKFKRKNVFILIILIFYFQITVDDKEINFPLEI